MADDRRGFASSSEVLRRRVTRPARVLVLDDHRLLAQMLVGHLSDRGHESLTIDAADDRLTERVLEVDPDLLLLDAVFTDDEGAGMRILTEVRDRAPHIEVVMITGVLERVRHAQFLAAGASAVIAKTDSFDQVTAQIEDVLNDVDPMGATRREELRLLLDAHDQTSALQGRQLASLTSSELSTLQGLVAGQTVQEMALQRTVAVSTVRSHVRAILRKLGVHSQLEAVAIAAECGLGPRRSE